MTKVRVHEIARNLEIDSKTLIKIIKELHIPVKSHMSTLSSVEVDKVLEYYSELEDENKKAKSATSKKKIELNERHKKTKKAKDDLPEAPIVKKEPMKKTEKKTRQNHEKRSAKTKLAKPDLKSKEDEELLYKIPDNVTVKEFSKIINKPISEIVKNLMMKGYMMTANQEMGFELAEEIAMEYDILIEKAEAVDLLEDYFSDKDDENVKLEKRPPVVVVMGHVDHGKTSLLDAIKETHVTDKEHGGITQHIGAYKVKVNGQDITFLDTPGHEAFTSMRLRGALATDIAVLVVAADDGVMPQTIEAINHAKAAKVQIIVAINKIDKPTANPDRVKQELIEHGLTAEDWGGDTICVPVSAITKTGIDQLLEMILLVSEMEELKANYKCPARGIVIEAELDKGRGSVATVLVQNGILHVGDNIIAGATYGRVRAMINDKGKRIKKAGPSTPVEILGLNDVPNAGDAFYVAKNDKEARLLSEKIKSDLREKMITAIPQKVTLDDLFHQIQEGEMKELKLIIKADVQGSVEAIKQSLIKLNNEEVLINIIHAGVGAINESDVMLASASNAIILGFNVRPEANAKQTAETEKIDIRLYRVIYNAIEDIELAMKGMLDPVYKEKVIGNLEIRQTFQVSGIGTIGGSYVTSGKIVRNAGVRLIRDNIVIYEGKLSSLKRFQDDAKEVTQGYECGIMIEKYNDIKVGDNVEAFIMEEVER